MIARMLAAHLRRRVARDLDGVWVAGLDEARETLARGPVVFAATHSAWWDGPLLLPLADGLRADGRVWMDAENLARLPFFRALGAVAVHPGEPGRLRADLRIAVDWLSGPGRAWWIFPQGRQRPTWVRPLGLQRGATRVARLAGAALVPVGVAYAFREAPAPAAFVDFGSPVAEEALEDGILAALARIDAHLVDPDPRFTALVPPTARSPQDGLAARLLAVLVRGG